MPPSASLTGVDTGAAWPWAFCAFQGCVWEDDRGTDVSLEQHLRASHLADLKPICDHMHSLLLGRAAEDELLSVYSQAVAIKCRAQAPIAGASLDRMALENFAHATSGNRVAALVCFCCGGIHPYVEEVASKSAINWYQPLQRSDADEEKFKFLGQPLEAIEELLGLQVYLSRYNVVEGRCQQAALTEHESFNDWRLRLPELKDGMLLCCPEAFGLLTDISPCEQIYYNNAGCVVMY